MKFKNGLEKFTGIEKDSVLVQFKELLSMMTDLDFEISDLEGFFVLLPCKSKGQRNNVCDYYLKNGCRTSITEILEGIKADKESKIFECSAGMKKIMVPLSLNGTVMGVLFAGENGSFRFNGSNLNSVLKLLQSIANYIVKNEISFFNYLKPGTKTYKELLLEKVKRYIKENYDNVELSLEDVAGNNNISYHYLSHLFRKELNTTFVKYRNRTRLESAASLLKDMSLSVNQISYKCGFDDPSYFCKVFKALHKCSPLTYRKKISKAKNYHRIANGSID